MNPGQGRDPQRKGSVRRAREMLDAGRRPEASAPQLNTHFSGVPAVNFPSPSNSHVTQWPLPDDGEAFETPGRLFIPKGPPPKRPPRPDAPSPSVYSERSARDVAPSPLHIRRPFPSFSQPLSTQNQPRRIMDEPPPYSPNSTTGLTPRVSIATEDLFRQSNASSIGSMPSIPDFPFPAQSYPDTPKKVAGLAPPGASMNGRSSVSPIPEELSDSPTLLKGSYASSKAVPSSWGSAPEAEVLEAYLDVESDDSDEPRRSIHDESNLVRQASLGTRGKPSLRTIQKPNASSPVPPPEGRAMKIRAAMAGSVLSGDQSVQGHEQGQRYSFDASSTSSKFDLEKAPIFLDLAHEHPAHRNGPEGQGMAGLSKATPTMSDRRPGARRPPRLDMSAVRDAEARGSLTSLPDLIRRATKLATNLEHGRTASRNDLLNGGKNAKGFGHRNSGSLQDIIQSFPPPRLRASDGHSSWPVFFRRSTLHNINSHDSMGEPDPEKSQQRQRRCCGMPLWIFILVCVIIILVIAAAVLIPIFLVVVPREKANNNPSCEQTTPCKNGGVSVSSGDICSCVCINGYTGSQCTIAADDSCITTEINEGSTTRNATMGTDLPQLFEDAQNNFSIPLDSITIMALFSQSNVSCTTENELVTFRGVQSSKRSFEHEALNQPSTTTTEPLPTLTARDSVATMNGIIFDNSTPTATHSSTATSTTQTSTPTPTSASSTKSKSTSISNTTLNFSRVAILYIFEKTGTLDAALQAEGIIQSHLSDSFANVNKKNVTLDLSRSGVQGRFWVDFEGYGIEMEEGDKVGGGTE